MQLLFCFFYLVTKQQPQWEGKYMKTPRVSHFFLWDNKQSHTGQCLPLYFITRTLKANITQADQLCFSLLASVKKKQKNGINHWVALCDCSTNAAERRCTRKGRGDGKSADAGFLRTKSQEAVPNTEIGEGVKRKSGEGKLIAILYRRARLSLGARRWKWRQRWREASAPSQR